MESLETVLGAWKLRRTEIEGYDTASEVLEFHADGTLVWTVVCKEGVPPTVVRRHFELTPDGYAHAARPGGPPAQVKCWREEEELATQPAHGLTSWFSRLTLEADLRA